MGREKEDFSGAGLASDYPEAGASFDTYSSNAHDQRRYRLTRWVCGEVGRGAWVGIIPT
jgi:hypothetical protein